MTTAYEVIEVCPHCGHENVWCVGCEACAKKLEYKARCTACGKTIMLCDECLHADDNPSQRCDFRTIDGCGVCFRGITGSDQDDRT